MRGRTCWISDYFVLIGDLIISLNMIYCATHFARSDLLATLIIVPCAKCYPKLSVIIDFHPWKWNDWKENTLLYVVKTKQFT